MDPVSIGIGLVSAIGGGLLKLIGGALAAGDRAKAMQILEEGYKQATGIQLPKQEVLKAVEQIESSLTGYREDPRLKAQQMRALEGLQAEVDMQGMTPEARAQYDIARSEAGEMAAGLEGAASMRAAQRGVGGLAAYAGALGGAQAGANRMGQMGVQIAGDARKRYLQALEALGGMGTQMRGQEFGFASQRAAAQDAINRFNAQQQAEAALYNIQAGQRDFNNQLAKQGLVQSAGGRLAAGYQGQAQQTEKDYGDAAAAVNELGQAGAKYPWDK